MWFARRAQNQRNAIAAKSLQRLKNRVKATLTLATALPGRQVALFARAVRLQDVTCTEQADGDYQKLQHLPGSDPIHQLSHHSQDGNRQTSELEDAGEGLHGSHGTRRAGKWQREA